MILTIFYECQARFIGKKGIPTQNIMVVCDWNMCFTFVLAGWEGTAHDAWFFDHALMTFNMNFLHPPQGIIFLYHHNWILFSFKFFYTYFYLSQHVNIIW